MNEIGECDLLFYHGPDSGMIVSHMIDRATRYADVCCIPNKEKETLIQAYLTTWPPRYGPFETLYSDGEGGLNNPEAKTELAHAGTKLINRPTCQHAHYIETRK